MLTKPIQSLKLTTVGLFIAVAPVVATTSVGAATSTPQSIVDSGATSVQMQVRDGSNVKDINAGTANNQAKPLKDQSQVRIGSTTKLMTSTAAMQLVEQGKLNLDATVETYLPGKLSFGKDITVRQLLSHTSGIPQNAYEAKLPYDEVATKTLKGMQDFLAQYYTNDQLLGYINETGLKTAPGTTWQYSNANFVIMDSIITNTSGMPYEDYVQKNIFDKAGMNASSMPDRETKIKQPYARGYLGSEFYGGQPGEKQIDLTRQSGSLFGGAGAAVSTTGDVNFFLQALYGGKLVSSQSLAEMQKVVVANPANYGLGTMQINSPCGVIRGHNGNVYGYTTTALYLNGKSVTVATAEGTNLYGALVPQANKLALNELCPQPTSGEDTSNAITPEARSALDSVLNQ